MIETTAIVKESSHFGNGYCRLKIEVEQLDVLPGQFAMLKPAGLEEPLLRRAMAFYTVETVNNKTLAEFIFHEIGRGTLALGRLRRGESVYFLGPLGKSFSTEPAKQHSKALIVGGGVGSPALLMLAKQLQGLSIQTEIFLGARSQQDLIGVEDFGSLG
ncbi:MAG: dihydroorotate dehydrogenase electron transfer subunit, partial [Blastocatellia bacterium]|nr:dihydroorotate dehydrogenase electron transfer subunit [Blastocatellia bacterium]